MNRWSRALLGSLLAITAFAAAAQGIIREAPKDEKPAIIAVSATPPIILVNGKEDRLSPGARIRDLNNLMVLSGSLAGKSVYTVYKRDSSGLVHEVWLLTPEEYKRVGGVNVENANGYARFMELLALVFAARQSK